MTRHDRFLLSVYLGALQRDIDLGRNDAQWITAYAERIPSTNIPPHPSNAAQVYLRFVTGQNTAPLKWMLPRPTCGRPGRPPNVVPLPHC